MKKHLMLKDEHESMVPELMQMKQYESDLKIKTDELNTKFNLKTELCDQEISNLKEEIDREKNKIAKLKQEKDEKNKKIKAKKQEIMNLELEIGDSNWKNNLAIGDLSHVLKSLENIKGKMVSDIESKEKLLAINSAEYHNLNIAHSETRNHKLRNIDSEPIRDVLTSNYDLTVQ